MCRVRVIILLVSSHNYYYKHKLVFLLYVSLPLELALLLDSLFMGMVLNKTVSFSLNTTIFPEFYQQESVEAKQVSDGSQGAKSVLCECVCL